MSVISVVIPRGVAGRFSLAGAQVIRIIPNVFKKVLGHHLVGKCRVDGPVVRQLSVTHVRVGVASEGVAGCNLTAHIGIGGPRSRACCSSLWARTQSSRFGHPVRCPATSRPSTARTTNAVRNWVNKVLVSVWSKGDGGLQEKGGLRTERDGWQNQTARNGKQKVFWGFVTRRGKTRRTDSRSIFWKTGGLCWNGSLETPASTILRKTSLSQFYCLST